MPWFYPVDPASDAFALPEDHGAYALNLCALDGKRLTDEENRYVIRLIEPDQVAEIAAALKPRDEAAMRKRYFRHCKGAWPEYGEQDIEYRWEYLAELRDVFARMAGNGAGGDLHHRSVMRAFSGRR